MGKPATKAPAREPAKGPDLTLVEKQQAAKTEPAAKPEQKRSAADAYRRLHPPRVWPD